MHAAKLQLLLPIAVVMLLFANCVSVPSACRADAQNAESRAECVIELSSRRFLHEKNADEPLPIASTTKILTALIILSDCTLDEVVCIPAEAERTDGSSVYLRKGELRTVEELLYGLLLRSGNDCAVSLAVHHSGSVAKFAAVMNIRAALLGAERSRFCNPHGLPQKGHLSTARDLALITAEAYRHPEFARIVATEKVTTGEGENARVMYNKNKLLSSLEGANGVKTGYTTRSGKCLVGGAVVDGVQRISVLLGASGDMWSVTRELLTKKV